MLRSFCLTLIITLCVQHAHAATIATIVPPAAANASYVINAAHSSYNSMTNPPGTAGVGVQYIAPEAQAAAAAGGNPAGAVTVFAATYSNNSQSEADASLIYYFTLQGPSGSSLIPVTVDGGLAWRVGATSDNLPGQQAWANINVNQGGAGFSYSVKSNCVLGNLSCLNGQLLHFNSTSNFLANTPVQILLSAHVMSLFAGSFASATADPVITIDPAFLEVNPGYTVVLSDGVGNAAAVTPIPASMPLFASALLGLIFLVRRQSCRQK